MAITIRLSLPKDGAERLLQIPLEELSRALGFPVTSIELVKDEEAKEGEKRVRECQRCQHVWVQRRREKPKRCPSCGSPYWDRPRK